MPASESKLSTQQQISSLWSLGGLSIRELGRRVYRGIFDDYLLDRASALAYNFILALFPLMLFLLAVFGIFASHSATLRLNLFNYLGQVLPPAAFEVINRTLAEVTRNAGGAKLTVGIVLTLWFAAGGMSSMISGLNGVYEVREARSFVKVRLTALALTCAISILIMSALAAILAGDFVANYVGSYFCGLLILADLLQRSRPRRATLVLDYPRCADWRPALGRGVVRFSRLSALF